MPQTPPPHPLRSLIQRAGGLTSVAQATGVNASSLSMMANDARPMSRTLLVKLREAGIDVDRLLVDVSEWRMERAKEANERLAVIAKGDAA